MFNDYGIYRLSTLRIDELIKERRRSAGADRARGPGPIERLLGGLGGRSERRYERVTPCREGDLSLEGC